MLISVVVEDHKVTGPSMEWNWKAPRLWLWVLLGLVVALVLIGELCISQLPGT